MVFFGVTQFPCLERDLDLPLITIANVVGYVILWSWELITSYGKHASSKHGHYV